MKSILKKIISPAAKSQIREWFPSAVKKEADLREIERKATFYRTFVETGSLCFDIGANMGNRITPLLSLGAKIIAVEPQEKCYRYLKKRFGKKIIIIKKGLGQFSGEKEFHLSNDSTLSSFSDTWMKAVTNTSRFKDKKWVETVKISMTTADNLIAKFGTPSFMKIDVEGYELEVLKGLTKQIECISFEYTVPEQPERAIHCLQEILKHNQEIECNYSVGEDMVWASANWLSFEEMKQLILSDAFQATSFGDIYVRSLPNRK